MKSIFNEIVKKINKSGVNANVSYDDIINVAKETCYYKGIKQVSKNTVYLYLRMLRNLGFIEKTDTRSIKVIKLIPEEPNSKMFRNAYKNICMKRLNK